jgi:hypothetical protein
MEKIILIELDQGWSGDPEIIYAFEYESVAALKALIEQAIQDCKDSMGLRQPEWDAYEKAKAEYDYSHHEKLCEELRSKGGLDLMVQIFRECEKHPKPPEDPCVHLKFGETRFPIDGNFKMDSVQILTLDEWFARENRSIEVEKNF